MELAKASSVALIDTAPANDNAPTGLSANVDANLLKWHGRTQRTPLAWAVPGWIPERSFGLLVGESGAGKTFTAIHLAVAAATGTGFLGMPVKHGGTLYVASEAPETIFERLDAAYATVWAETTLSTPLPIAILDDFANLAKPKNVDNLIGYASAADAQMRSEHRVGLTLIIIDTMLAAFGIDDWNSASGSTHAMMELKRICKETGTTVIGIHHHGKAIERGPAGSFALQGHADFVVSVYKKEPRPGEVKERWATVTKSRRGPTGDKRYFDLQEQMINSDVVGGPAFAGYVALSERQDRNASGEEALMHGKGVVSLIAAIKECPPRNSPDGDAVYAGPFNEVRDNFFTSYPVDSSVSTKKAQASKRAFSRALDAALERQLVGMQDWNGLTMIVLLNDPL